MSDRIVSADEARALLDGTTSGPWTYDPPNEQCPAWITQAHDPTEDVALIEDVLDVDGRLMASAPDLARSVEALHASESAAVARASRLALDLTALSALLCEARAELARVTAERDELVRRMESMPPWDLSSPPTDDELRALLCRWSTGPERYQADADMLIAAVMDLREKHAAASFALQREAQRHEALARVTAECDALREVVAALPKCRVCRKPSTADVLGRFACDDHIDEVGPREEAVDHSWAGTLRALVEAPAGESGGERE